MELDAVCFYRFVFSEYLFVCQVAKEPTLKLKQILTFPFKLFVNEV